MLVWAPGHLSNKDVCILYCRLPPYRVVSARDLGYAICVKTHASAILVHIRNASIIHVAMVGCICLECEKRSEVDTDVSFYRISAVRSEKEFELSLRRKDGFLAAISWENIDVNSLSSRRICSRHFISGKPADLYDCTNPDWLPTLNLGHSKRVTQQPCSTASSSSLATARYDRAQRRSKEQQEQQQFRERFSDIILQELTESIVDEEVLDAAEEFLMIKETLSNFVDEVISEVVEDDVRKAARDEMEVEILKRCEGSCKCQSEIAALRAELSKCYATIDELTLKVQQSSNSMYPKLLFQGYCQNG